MKYREPAPWPHPDRTRRRWAFVVFGLIVPALSMLAHPAVAGAEDPSQWIVAPSLAPLDGRELAFGLPLAAAGWCALLAFVLRGARAATPRAVVVGLGLGVLLGLAWSAGLVAEGWSHGRGVGTGIVRVAALLLVAWALSPRRAPVDTRGRGGLERPRDPGSATPGAAGSSVTGGGVRRTDSWEHGGPVAGPHGVPVAFTVAFAIGVVTWVSRPASSPWTTGLVLLVLLPTVGAGLDWLFARWRASQRARAGRAGHVLGARTLVITGLEIGAVCAMVAVALLLSGVAAPLPSGIATGGVLVAPMLVAVLVRVLGTLMLFAAGLLAREMIIDLGPMLLGLACAAALIELRRASAMDDVRGHRSGAACADG